MMMENESEHDVPVKKGILNKKGRGQFYRPWYLRTIILDYNKFKLSYYSENQLKGEIDLKGINLRSLPPAEADGRLYAFEISNITDSSNSKSYGHNSLVLAALSADEASDWMEAIANTAYNANKTSKSQSVVEHVYESFQGALDSKLLPQPILDASYYKSLRARQQDERSGTSPKRSVPPRSSPTSITTPSTSLASNDNGATNSYISLSALPTSEKSISNTKAEKSI